ncbi:MAG TPA: hypothetical protein VFE60_23215, partial [Roseiarcus sp.]|nr:hypothetical protein [Roseiarcus sp.]
DYVGARRSFGQRANQVLRTAEAYTVDDTVLRTGSANFSAGGKRARDDDLIVIRDVGAAGEIRVSL